MSGEIQRFFCRHNWSDQDGRGLVEKADPRSMDPGPWTPVHGPPLPPKCWKNRKQTIWSIHSNVFAADMCLDVWFQHRRESIKIVTDAKVIRWQNAIILSSQLRLKITPKPRPSMYSKVTSCNIVYWNQQAYSVATASVQCSVFWGIQDPNIAAHRSCESHSTRDYIQTSPRWGDADSQSGSRFQSWSWIIAVILPVYTLGLCDSAWSRMPTANSLSFCSKSGKLQTGQSSTSDPLQSGIQRYWFWLHCGTQHTSLCPLKLSSAPKEHLKGGRPVWLASVSPQLSDWQPQNGNYNPLQQHLVDWMAKPQVACVSAMASCLQHSEVQWLWTPSSNYGLCRLLLLLVRRKDGWQWPGNDENQLLLIERYRCFPSFPRRKNHSSANKDFKLLGYNAALSFLQVWWLTSISFHDRFKAISRASASSSVWYSQIFVVPATTAA